jgi:LppX_LprAFG lipoprotein
VRRIILLVTMVISIALVLAACGGGSSGTPTPTAVTPTAEATTPVPETPIPTETATAAATETAVETATAASGGGQDISGITSKASDAYKSVKSIHITMDISAEAGGQTTKITAEGDMVPPDKSHITMDMGGIKFEVITIGTDSYTKMGEQWTKSAVTQTASSDPSKMAENVVLPKTGTKLADESVDGVDCYHIQYTGAEMAASDPNYADLGDSTVDVWVAKDTDLVKKMVIVVKDSAGAVNSSITMNFTKYNEPVEITAPI